LVTFERSKLGYTPNSFATIDLVSATDSICKLFNVIGAENAPIEKVLSTFSLKLEVNSKLPCVNPPPSTT
jgi:hypothetical protein